MEKHAERRPTLDSAARYIWKRGVLPAVLFLGADEKHLQVKIDGNAMPLPWSWLKDRDVLALV